MKTTVKIDCTSQSNGNFPIIKIVQPVDCLEFPAETDYDVKDRLVRDFLQRPGHVGRNEWFKLDTYYPNDFDKPTHYITNIAPVHLENLFYRFRHAILGRIVPYDSICKLNQWGYENGAKSAVGNITEPQRPLEEREAAFHKIHEFFNWLDEIGWVDYEKQMPERPMPKASRG